MRIPTFISIGRKRRKLSQPTNRGHRGRRPRFEMLEARRLLATYYVDGVGGDGLAGGGSNSNAGTSIAAPFLTLSKANSVVSPGDTVEIRGGTYAEQIKPSTSGTSNAKITYTNYQNEVANITGLEGPRLAIWQITPIDVGSRSYIVVDDLDFRLQRDTLQGDVVFFRGSFNELRNSRIISTDPNTVEGHRVPLNGTTPRTFGVSIKGSNGNTLEGNTIAGWWSGLKANNATNATIRRNVFANNSANQIKIASNGQILGQLYEGNIIGGSITSDGIQTDSDGGSTTAIEIRGVVIRDNYFYFNAENAIDLKAGGDIVIEGNVMVATLADNDGTGVVSVSGDDANRGMGTVSAGSNRNTERVIVRNNTLYDNSGGVELRGQYWKVYNNTFVANNRDIDGPNSSYDAAAVNLPNWRENLANFVGASWRQKFGTSFVNNIVVDHKDAVLRKPVAGSNQEEINNNLYYDDGNPLLFYKGKSKIQNLIPLDFTQWKSFLASESGNIGGDVDSIVADPLFVDVPSQPSFPFFNFTQPDVENPVFMPVIGFDDLDTWFPYDFSLQSNSPAIDAGKTLTDAISSGTNSTTLNVTDSHFFFDGYNIAGEGDVIQIGSAAPVKITGINYATNVITLEAARTWASGDSVSLTYEGTAPDIGAFEFSAPTADFDTDGDVDGFDFLLWQRGFGTPAPNATLADGDADSDQDVDDADLAVWQGAFGTTAALPIVSETTPAPESVASISVAGPELTETVAEDQVAVGDDVSQSPSLDAQVRSFGETFQRPSFTHAETSAFDADEIDVFRLVAEDTSHSFDLGHDRVNNKAESESRSVDERRLPSHALLYDFVFAEMLDSHSQNDMDWLFRS